MPFIEDKSKSKTFTFQSEYSANIRSYLLKNNK